MMSKAVSSLAGRTVAVCFGCDEAFFGFAKGLVLSLAGKLDAESALCFIDAGISASSRKWLEDRNVRITDFDPAQFNPAFRLHLASSYVNAQICRPYLPLLLPGYDVYVWLDSDTWVQNPASIRSFVASSSAHPGKIAISSTDPWAYEFTPAQAQEFQNYSYLWYEGIFGSAMAATYSDKKILNSGFFALANCSAVWSLWRAEVERFYSSSFQRPAWLLHMAEQTALNYVAYAHECFVEFNSFHNYNCHMALPERRGSRVGLRHRGEQEIGIVHLTVASQFGAEYLCRGLLFDEGRYLSEPEKRAILSLRPIG